MQCPRCLNKDESYFYRGKRGYYCRRCVSFSRIMIMDELEETVLHDVNEESEEYVLKYPLTKDQLKISQDCAKLIKQSDVLIHAVCGAGKTELVVLSIAKALKEKKKVAFAVPRRQVVIELTKRFKSIFPKANVVAVYGGHTAEIDGDLIVATTHQLYRYYQAFDLLILDEPDAFPFYGNATLHGIARTSCKANIIYLTATPDSYLSRRVKKGEMAYLSLSQRPHGYKLPVPKAKCTFLPMRMVVLLKWLSKWQKYPRIVFMPTIAGAKKMSLFLSLFYKNYLVTSKSEGKEQIIESFRKDLEGICVATTTLERGVTIANVQICVYEADHFIFSKSALIQMAGRAGRTFRYPKGDVLFILKKQSEKVDECIKEIERSNNHEMSVMP